MNLYHKFLDSLGVTSSKFLKILGVVVVALLLVSWFFGSGERVFRGALQKSGVYNDSSPGMAYDADTMAVGESAMGYGGGNSVAFSTRNVLPPSPQPPGDGYVPGEDSEEFEVTEYNARIETRNLEETCGAFTELKSRDDVVFELTNSYEQGCNFTFKVLRASVSEVVSFLEDLDLEELNEQIYTIKRLVDDYTSEIDILERKKEFIEATLENAIRAYDDVTLLATRTQDAESLAKIIDSKIGVIERLTQQQINVSAQLERILRSKADQLDRLDYTYFSVNVYERKYIDGEELANSWKNMLQRLVWNINSIVQQITLGLLGFLFLVLQYVVYGLILLLVAKYGWKAVRAIWPK